LGSNECFAIQPALIEETAVIDTLTTKGRIVSALLRLAAERPWTHISMLDIADAAGMSLVDLRKEFERKSQMLSSLGYMIDEQVLRKAPRPAPGQSPRDAVFDVVMSRFDAMLPYRAALKSASEGGALDGSLLKSLLRSQTAMLQASGIDTEGPGGGLRVAGLAGVFTRVFHTWLDDTDPGMARTMAALDRQLRSGERTLQMVDGACDSLKRFTDIFKPGSRPTSTGTPPVPPAPV
jgi:ubiquinone biosynthesis protein COQ9